MPIKVVGPEGGITSCGFRKSLSNLLTGTFALRRADVGIRLPVIES